MTRQHALAGAMLWAAAIIAAAAVHAPTFLSLTLLPSLAIISLLARADACINRSVTP